MQQRVNGTESVKIDNTFKIDFIALNESRRIQLQFATDRMKIGSKELETQPAKGARHHYAGVMTSRDVIGLPPVTLCNCLLTVEDYTKETRNFRHYFSKTDEKRTHATKG